MFACDGNVPRYQRFIAALRVVGIRSFSLEINEICPRGHEEAKNRLDKKERKKKKKTYTRTRTRFNAERSIPRDRIISKKKKKKRKREKTRKDGKLAAFAW